MNGKMRSSENYSQDINSHLLNPFVHKLELDNAYDKIKTAVFTVILMPFRVVVICVLLITAWMLACLGLYGLTEEELRAKPMLGWRRALKSAICLIGRWSYLAGGMAITVKGRRAHRSQAPILVVAPHSSFLDSVIVYVTHMASIIVRRESNDNHYVGKLINYTQPVYVWRDDPNSRHNTIKEIIDRATSELDWPQVLIFPEGTCTNRSCLITFKPGAFYPAVPIQPVCIRYPNKLDTVTWTWEGPGALKLLWLTLTQIHSHCEIEFLPVYYPNEAEKSDPKLYAANVRNVMARALNVPVSDYTYDDCKLMNRAKKLNLPHVAAIVEFEKLRRVLGLHKTNIEETIISNAGGIAAEDNFMVTIYEMASRLKVPVDDPAFQKLFSIYDQDNTGSIDMRDYLLCALFVIKPTIHPLEFIQHAFKMYDRTGMGMLNVKDFYHVAKKTLAWSYEDSEAVFQQIDIKNKKYISFDQFKTYSASKPELKYMHRVSDNSVHEKSQ